MKNDVLMKKHMRFDQPTNFSGRKWKQIENFKNKEFIKSRQIAGAIPGWIDAASTMG